MKIYNFLLIFIIVCLTFALAEKAENVENKEESIEQAEKTEDVENEKEEIVDESKKTEKGQRFPDKAFIEELHYGLRCPEADPEHPYELDEKFTRIDFHTNSVVLDINPTIETHNYTIAHTCSPYFYVRYTKGYRFAITSYEFRGTYHLEEGIRAVIKSENTDAITHVFEGPAMGTYEFTDELDWSGWRKPIHGKFQDGKLWFGCGTDLIRISVGVQALLNNRLNEKGSGTLVLKDFSANIVWDKCPKQKKKYIPTDEELLRAVIPKKTQEEIEKEKKAKEEAKAAKQIPESKRTKTPANVDDKPSDNKTTDEKKSDDKTTDDKKSE